VFENRVLREMFEPEREEVAGNWRRLHNEEFYNLYTSPNILRVIKSRRMRYVEQVAHMEQMRHTVFWLGNLKGRDHLEDIGIDGNIILDGISGK
jgi:uncharacterized protein YjiS (DUF1127 family)